MARIKSIAAVIAVLVLPGLAMLAALMLAPDAKPPNVQDVVRIGEANTPYPSTPPPASTPPPTTTSTPPVLPPPTPVDDDDDDGDDDGDG